MNMLVPSLSFFAIKFLIFFNYLAEKSTASTEPDLNQRPKDYCQILISHYSPALYQLSYQWSLSYEYASTEIKLFRYKIFYFFNYLAENSTASTELDLNQPPKDYCQIFISHYSPPLCQLSYQWNLSYEYASTEFKLLCYKIFNFFNYLAENITASTEPDSNQPAKDYCPILISHYSPPLFQLSYQWSLSYEYASTEFKLFRYKIFYFFNYLAENSTASTEKDLNQPPKDYCQIFISHYSPPLCQLSYQWNLSYEYASTEFKLLCYKIFYFFNYLAENSTASTEPDMNQRPKDYCQILISHYSPALYQLSYQWNLSYEYASTEFKLLCYKIFYFFNYLVENSTASTEPDLNQ